MKVLFLRIFLSLLLVILQLSFFDILFPWPQAPIFLLVAVVAWTLVLGFPHSLYVTIPLTLIFDTIAYGGVSWFSLYAVLFSYGTSFLSRRLLIEHRGMSLMLYALFTAVGILVYQLVTPFISRTFSAIAAHAAWDPLHSVMIGLASFLFASFLFPCVYLILKRFESYVELTTQKQFLNIR